MSNAIGRYQSNAPTVSGSLVFRVERLDRNQDSRLHDPRLLTELRARLCFISVFPIRENRCFRPIFQGDVGSFKTNATSVVGVFQACYLVKM